MQSGADPCGLVGGAGVGEMEAVDAGGCGACLGDRVTQGGAICHRGR